MSHSIAAAAARRTMLVLPLVVILALSASMPVAAAWSGQKSVSDAYLNAQWFDNDLITQEGGYLHFFYSNEDGPTHQKTFPDGTTVGSPKLLELTSSYGDAEGIASDGTLIVALYRNNSTPNTLEIRRSTSGGVFWLAAQVINSYPGKQWMGNGAVAVSGTTVLVAWTDRRNGKIYLRRSTDSGVSFGPKLLLGITTAVYYPEGDTDGQVHLAASGSSVGAVWNAAQTARIYPKRLVMRRSTDGGATFKPVKTLDAGAQETEGPSVAMLGQEMLVSHTTKAGNVRVLRSTNGGVSFTSTDLSGTRHSDDRADVAIDPADVQTVRAVWFSRGKIYLRRSSNGGATWAPAEHTHGRGPKHATVMPNVFVGGGETLVAWNGLVYSQADGYDADTIVARSDP